jgi:UDP-N-acetylmuramoylalanine--D-glutamate ligase
MAGERIHNLLANNNVLSGRNYFISNSYPDIVEWCFRHTQKGKTCLLSPAASSYDAFKNFEERGKLFKELVRNRKTN